MAGHFPRGNSGAIISAASNISANIDSNEMLVRAGHGLETYNKSYARVEPLRTMDEIEKLVAEGQSVYADEALIA